MGDASRWSGRAYIVGTFDTKSAELRYVCDLLEQAGLRTATVDISTGQPVEQVDVPAREVAAHGLDGGAGTLSGDRGTAVAAMTEAFRRFLPTRTDLAGVIGLGGSGGTAVVTAGLQALPVGLPKVMVSTMASSDVSGYVGVSDVVMVPSVTDLAGLNGLSRTILGNAAHALAGMLTARPPALVDVRPALGLTMFGVTTPCVTAVVQALEDRYDCLVFHATGTGGRAMEKLVDGGLLAGVLDISTTEVADLLVGGVLAATEDRFGAPARTGLPYVGSCGALDMVNFGARSTVPARFAGRTLYEHNASVTLMRTTADECRCIGEWVGSRLNALEGPVRFLLPEGGLSMIDAPDQPFFDPEADAALFEALERTVVQTDRRRLVRSPSHVNDPDFAAALVEAFLEVVREPPPPSPSDLELPRAASSQP